MDSLMVGAVLALIPLPSLRTARIVGAAALLVYGLLTWWGHSMFFLSRPIQGAGYSALALLSGSLLVLSFYPTTIVHRVCSWSVLRFYGKYSYGLYLWHYLFSKPFGILTVWVQRRVSVPLVSSVLRFGWILLWFPLVALTCPRFVQKLSLYL